MKRFRWVLGVAVIALLAGGFAFAQGQTGQSRRQGGPGGPGGRGFGGPAGIELRGLDLTDTQREQIRDIVQRYQQQMRSDIMLVLTPEQQQKLQQAEAQREARLKERLQRMEQQRQQQNR